MSKTSWQVKDRYNRKVYGQIYCLLPKEMVSEFKEKCRLEGVSQASVIRDAIERYLEK